MHVTQGRREEGMQLVMYRTYSSDFISEVGYTKNGIQYMDVNKWAVLFTEIIIMGVYIRTI